jgi:hypothetical protein
LWHTHQQEQLKYIIMPKKNKKGNKIQDKDIEAVAMGLTLGKSRAMYLLNETVNGFRDMLNDDQAFADFDDVTAEGKREAVKASLKTGTWIMQYVDQAWDRVPESTPLKAGEKLAWDED